MRRSSELLKRLCLLALPIAALHAQSKSRPARTWANTGCLRRSFIVFSHQSVQAVKALTHVAGCQTQYTRTLPGRWYHARTQPIPCPGFSGLSRS